MGFVDKNNGGITIRVLETDKDYQIGSLIRVSPSPRRRCHQNHPVSGVNSGERLSCVNVWRAKETRRETSKKDLRRLGTGQ